MNGMRLVFPLERTPYCIDFIDDGSTPWPAIIFWPGSHTPRFYISSGLSINEKTYINFVKQKQYIQDFEGIINEI